MRRQRVRACARGEDTPSSPVRLRYTPFRLMSFNFESRGRSRKGREAADLKEPSDGRNGNYCTALINAIRSTAAAAIDGRILLICRMRNGLALCARRLAIHFRWTGRKQRGIKSRPPPSLSLHFAPCVLPFLDSFQRPSLSLVCMSAGRKREEHPLLRRTRRDGTRIGGGRRTQSTTRLVRCFTCFSLFLCPVQQQQLILFLNSLTLTKDEICCWPFSETWPLYSVQLLVSPDIF